MTIINNLHPFVKYCLENNIFQGLTQKISDDIYDYFLDAGKQKLIIMNICPYGDIWYLKENVDNPYIFLYWCKHNKTTGNVNLIPEYLRNSYNWAKQLKFVSTNVSILGDIWTLTYWGKKNIMYYIDNPNIMQKIWYKLLNIFY